MGISLANVRDKTQTKHLVCKYCYNLLENPVVIINCKHLFCRQCIDEYSRKHCVTTGETKKTCPDCAGPFTGLDTPDQVIQNILNDIPMRCEYKDCTEQISLRNFGDHLKTCKYGAKSCRYCANTIPIADADNHQVNLFI